MLINRSVDGAAQRRHKREGVVLHWATTRPLHACGRRDPLRADPLGSLCRYLDDGRIDIDNSTVERAIRPIALGRKNHLFAGSDGGAARWAIVVSLLDTAKVNEVEPFAYLKDVLERMSSGHPMSWLDELLPWNWAD